MFIGNYFLYLLLVMLIPILAQSYVMKNVNKYSKVRANKGLTGYEVARRILNDNGLDDVSIEQVNGFLSDHYDPASKTVRLSAKNYSGNSITAASIAAHECGHAIQDADNYLFLTVRKALFPLVNFGSKIAWIAILIGIIANQSQFLLIGIFAIAAIVLFQFVTLPVEFNASSRAIVFLSSAGMINRDEETGVKHVLNSAALTYVAATTVSMLELLRLIMIYNRRN